MRSMLLVLVAATLSVAGIASAAGPNKGSIELGGYGGYGLLDDYGTLNPKDGPFFGARLGYFLTRTISLEANAQRQPTHFEAAPGFPEQDVHLDAARINAFYNFAPNFPLRPFLTAGGGWESMDPDGGDQTTDFGWNAGGGVRMMLSKNWSVRADGRYVQARNDVLDRQISNVELSGGLSVHFGGSEVVEPETTPAPETPAPANSEPTVSCVTDRTEVAPGEAVRVTATASDPDGDPLSYQWSTSTGQVSGEGSTATLQFDGTTAPATATVTVRVTDNHGHDATSACAVNLVQPVKQQAEAVSCLANGFPNNLSRLTNVDKACLDDMAQRLKSDPNSHVIVIGHADSHERSPKSMGTQRANAVRDYLVQSGVDASRITTRSSGDTTPASTDASMVASNRRVEVWFVPEGATEP